MKARRIAAVVVVLALAAGGAAWWYWSAGEAKVPGRLTLYGNVDIRQVDLAFNVEGRLQAMLAEEGDKVKAGQVLARLEPDYLDRALNVATARAEAQQAVVDKLEAGSRPQEVARAKAELAEAEAAADNARRTFTRQKELARRDTASQQALDDARGALNRADARAAAARESLALMVAGPRKEDIAAARAQLAADHATVSLIHRRLQDATLAAPADGVILTRAREPGAVLLPTSTVYSMALTTPVWVRTYVSESDLGRVHPGMAATVTTDSAPDHAYTGQIGFISPVAEFTPKTVETPELRTSLVYRLRVVVENPDEGLRQGMPVTVTLDTGGAG